MSAATSAVGIRKLWFVGPLAVLASISGVLIDRVIAVEILKPNPAPPGLGWVMPIVFTLVLCSAAVLVFAVVARFAKNPIRTYQIIALAVLLLTFLPDVAFASAPFPGAGWPNAVALMSMHVVAWAITVTMLSRYTLAKETI